MSEVLPETRIEHLVAARGSRVREGGYIGASIVTTVAGVILAKNGIEQESTSQIIGGSSFVLGGALSAWKSRIHAGVANYHELAAANLVTRGE